MYIYAVYIYLNYMLLSYVRCGEIYMSKVKRMRECVPYFTCTLFYTILNASISGNKCEL